jgi:hypothetical protein
MPDGSGLVWSKMGWGHGRQSANFDCEFFVALVQLAVLGFVVNYWLLAF